MNRKESADLDRFITGNSGEDDPRVKQAADVMQRFVSEILTSTFPPAVPEYDLEIEHDSLCLAGLTAHKQKWIAWYDLDTEDSDEPPYQRKTVAWLKHITLDGPFDQRIYFFQRDIDPMVWGDVESICQDNYEEGQ